jgi:hypothetical protein
MVGIGFCGCSLTEGVPFVEFNSRYSNLVNDYFKPSLFLNYAKGGSGNRDIFLQALQMILTDVDYIFVQWSLPGRQKWKYGWDRTVTTSMSEYINPLKNVLSDTKFENFVDVFKIIDNDYNQYTELNTQIGIINDICKKSNKNVYYINGGMYVDPMFLNETEISNIYEQLLPYSLEILDIDNLTDSDIEKSIKEIRKMLSVIDKKQWVDIEQMAHIDKGNDGIHPGPESNMLLANKIIKFLENKIK